MIASGVVANGVHGRMMQVSGEMYALKRPKFTLKFFTDYDEAVAWLESHL